MSPSSTAGQSRRMESLESHIRKHPFWAGLDPQYFPLLIEGARWVRFEAEEVIANAGEPAADFFLLLRGSVEIQNMATDGPVTVQKIGPEEALGWAWLFPPYTWHSTIRAVEQTDAIGWSTADLRKKAAANPAFGYDLACRLSRILHQRLNATYDQLVALTDAET